MSELPPGRAGLLHSHDPGRRPGPVRGIWCRFSRSCAWKRVADELSGDRHRAAPKLLAPTLYGTRMRHYGAVQGTTLAELCRWPRGRAFDVRPSLRTISLHVILGAVLGLRASAEIERFETLSQALAAVRR
jgi:cytochrome P450